MPKRVDHRARRTEIADALMRVAASRGLEAVSLRHVAAEAGVSPGMVQHYFRTKDEMMTFALAVVSERVEARLAAGEGPTGPGGAGDAVPPGAAVRALLVQLLPLDEPRHLEGHVGLAFHAYAAVRPDVAADLRRETGLMLGFVADAVRAAQESGDAPTGLDPDHAARTLLALVEGLSMHVLSGYHAPEDALATFDAHLATVFHRG